MIFKLLRVCDSTWSGFPWREIIGKNCIHSWLCLQEELVFKNGYVGGFPGDPVVKSLPANAGYTCSIPLASGRLRLCNTATELASHKLLKSRPWSPRFKQEKPPQREACALPERVTPAHHNWRKPSHSSEDLGGQ